MVQSAEKSLEEVRNAAFGKGFRKIATIPGDGPGIDSFGRQRISGNDTVFESKPQWDINPLTWETLLVGTATATFDLNADSISLAVPANGDRVVRQSHGYIPYQPGKSQQIFLTGLLAEKPVDAVSRCGYYDDDDGIFCETRETGTGWTLRSAVSGSAVDTFVPQEEWNLDTLIQNASKTPSAANPSAIQLDITKTQVFVIDYQWLGVGRVRCGYDIGGEIIYVHEFLNANMIDTIYMRTGSLPVRFELEATGPSPDVGDVSQICASVASEGGSLNLRGMEFSAGNEDTLRSVASGVKVPVCSIRNALLFKTQDNRIPIDPEAFLAITNANPIYWEVILNGALTGASFAAVDANSSMEVDVAATVVMGGTRIRSGYLTTAGPGASASGSDGPRLMGDLRMALDITAGVADILTFAATGIGGTASVGAEANWREHQ